MIHPEWLRIKLSRNPNPTKTDDNNVILSAIVLRGGKLNEKAEKVNKASLLEKGC